ncbi:Hypothetical predicted protein [Mytilus galloprovincialis]|uniref:RNase H type-1 domain-containing protein n=1 Tax=Mytilus galloprovincialis TaxID=29158 RepID=A0A8B6G823_MYTGA|nr:Hypothetical predicted protein [Mytilus galloprovincialis]
MANQIRDDLKKSGFVANEIKSVWTPQQSIEWLGFIWNLSNSTLEIPNKKFQGLKLCISALLEDASEYAGAGFTVGDNHIVHFMWDKEDRIKSSTWRELKAVKNILESLQLMLCGKLVKLYTDNQNVVKIVQKGTSGVDAFAYDWSKFNNWVVPPVNLITRAINHMQMCKAKGVLVVPKWKSAIFWPRIVDRFN